MNSTQMRDAIAKALGMNPADIQILDVGVNDADQAIPAPGTWAQSQADKNLTRAVGAADEIEALHHKVLHLEVKNKELTRRNGRQCATINELHHKVLHLEVKNKELTRRNDRQCATINELHHKVLHLEVKNKELTRRNDRQCATINELHEKLAGSEALADKKAMCKSLVRDISLAQGLMSEIFDGHDALTGNEAFPKEVLESINTELDLLGQRLYNLGEYVTRNL